MRHRSVSIAVVCFVLLALGAFLVAFEYLAPPPPADTLLEGKLTQVQEKALDLIIDLTRLFMAWSIAVIGAVGYFLQMHRDTSSPLTRAQLLVVEFIILVSVVSIFFGHLTITSLTESLALDVLSLLEGPHALYETLQYLLFLVSLIAFGVFVHLTHWMSVKGK
jgi:hypothetical protein